MEQTARLRLIRDRFIAGHSGCELRRHLDSVPPRVCRVWENHADPAVRRISKPSPDAIYPAYVVGDADRTSETSRVAAVTGHRSGTNQLEDLFRCLITTMESLARRRRCLQWKSCYSEWWRKHRVVHLRL